MRIVNTRSLKSGMLLGKPVFTSNGNILLNSGVKLTDAFIRSLKQKRIPAVYIDDDISKGIDVENAIDLEVKIKAVETIKNVFKDISNHQKGRKTKAFVSQKAYRAVNDVINTIIENLQKNNDCLFNMVEVMSTDLSSYIHSVNVATLSILTARSLGFTKQNLIDLGTGALMHDIGKSQIPLDVSNDSEPLSESDREIMKKHSVIGYNMVKDSSSISAYVKTIILMHHEKLDGSGYPLGVKEDKINDYVKIVSICNMFDNSISDKLNPEKMPIYKALEFIQSQVGKKLDKKVYSKFVKNISIFPQGTGVLLNTGEKGLVIHENHQIPTRPKVKIIRQKDGTFYPGFKTVDLMKDLTVFIEDTCDVAV